MRRRQRSSAQPHARRAGRHGRRVLIKRGGRALFYRAPAWAVTLPVGLGAALMTVSAITGYVWEGVVALAVVVLAWLALALRVTRLASAGPRGDGPASPGGAGVREPRRPLPYAPAGAAAMPPPEEVPPQRAAAQVEGVATPT
jgi:hypothetical protein